MARSSDSPVMAGQTPVSVQPSHLPNSSITAPTKPDTNFPYRCQAPALPRRPIFQRIVRVPLVVMVESNRQVAQYCFSIQLGHLRHIVALDRLHEVLCHAVALRAAYRRGHRLYADLSSKKTRLFGYVDRTVIAYPLHRRGRQLIAKTLLHAFKDCHGTVGRRWCW